MESLVAIASKLIPYGGTAVEFCSGGGYVGLALAWNRKDVFVWLTDMNAISLAYAMKRASDMGLTNVRAVRSELSELVLVSNELDVEDEVNAEQHPMEHDIAVTSKVVTTSLRPEDAVESQGTSASSSPMDVRLSSASATSASTTSASTTRESRAILTSDSKSMLKSMDLGIALHACGPATDVTHQLCLKRRASFVLSPCCYGFLQHWTDGCERGISFPRSNAFANAGCTPGWFSELCSCADRTFWSHDSRASTFNEAGSAAMRAVDSDRLLAAQELGYDVLPMLMTPPEASPKNHILVGRYGAKIRDVIEV